MWFSQKINGLDMAERVGFELTIPLQVRRISSAWHTTLYLTAGMACEARAGVDERAICTLPTIADVRHQDSTFAITALFTLTFAPMTPVSSPCSHALESCQDCFSDEGLRSITNGSTQALETGQAAVSALGHG